MNNSHGYGWFWQDYICKTTMFLFNRYHILMHYNSQIFTIYDLQGFISGLGFHSNGSYEFLKSDR